jgi:hypothetical protein
MQNKGSRPPQHVSLGNHQRTANAGFLSDPVLHVAHEVRNASLQRVDSALACCLHVKADVCQRGLLADIHGALEICAYESAHSVAVSSGRAGSFDAVEHYVVR